MFPEKFHNQVFLGLVTVTVAVAMTEASVLDCMGRSASATYQVTELHADQQSGLLSWELSSGSHSQISVIDEDMSAMISRDDRSEVCVAGWGQ